MADSAPKFRIFGRSGLFGTMLVATGVLPYVLSSSSNISHAVRERYLSIVGSSHDVAGESVAPEAVAPRTILEATGGVPLEGAGVTLPQAFSFQPTTAWVLGHWSRVSTSLAELDLQGYRVPLVTGTADGDLAGSLTYYFGPRQRIERISFTGTTGDARPLVGWLARQHHFVRVLTPDPSLYLYQAREGRKVIGQLQIRPARIVRAGAPRDRFEVSLEMNRPSA